MIFPGHSENSYLQLFSDYTANAKKIDRKKRSIELFNSCPRWESNPHPIARTRT